MENIRLCIQLWIRFCQKAQGSKCTVSYLPFGYGELSFNKELGGKPEVFFVITRTPQCTFCGDVDKAKDFPLANLFPNFTHVKVEFNWEGFKPKVRNPKECHELISTNVTQLPGSNEAVFFDPTKGYCHPSCATECSVSPRPNAIKCLVLGRCPYPCLREVYKLRDRRPSRQAEKEARCRKEGGEGEDKGRRRTGDSRGGGDVDAVEGEAGGRPAEY